MADPVVRRRRRELLAIAFLHMAMAPIGRLVLLLVVGSIFWEA